MPNSLLTKFLEGLIEKRCKNNSGSWATTTVKREVIKPNVALITTSEPKTSDGVHDQVNVSRDDWDSYCNNPANRQMVQVKNEKDIAGTILILLIFILLISVRWGSVSNF